MLLYLYEQWLEHHALSDQVHLASSALIVNVLWRFCKWAPSMPHLGDSCQ